MAVNGIRSGHRINMLRHVRRLFHDKRLSQHLYVLLSERHHNPGHSGGGGGGDPRCEGCGGGGGGKGRRK